MNNKMAGYLDDREIAILELHTTVNKYKTTDKELPDKFITKHPA